MFGLNLLWFEGLDPVNWFDHTCWLAVITPTDRPKSVRNCCVTKGFGGVFVLSICHRTKSDLFLFLLDLFHDLSVIAVSGALPLMTRRGESFALFPSFKASAQGFVKFHSSRFLSD